MTRPPKTPPPERLIDEDAIGLIYRPDAATAVERLAKVGITVAVPPEVRERLRALEVYWLLLPRRLRRFAWMRGGTVTKARRVF